MCQEKPGGFAVPAAREADRRSLSHALQPIEELTLRLRAKLNIGNVNERFSPTEYCRLCDRRLNRSLWYDGFVRPMENVVCGQPEGFQMNTMSLRRFVAPPLLMLLLPACDPTHHNVTESPALQLKASAADVLGPQVPARSAQARPGRVIMFEAFYPDDIRILKESRTITHVCVAFDVPTTTTTSAYWPARKATFLEAAKELPRRIKLVVRFKMVPSYSTDWSVPHPHSRDWYLKLRRFIQRVKSEHPRILTFIDTEFNGGAKEERGLNVYDVQRAAEAQVLAGWGPNQFQTDFALPSMLRDTIVKPANPAQPDSYRQNWAAKMMGKRLIAPAYWTRRLKRVPPGQMAQLVLQTKYTSAKAAAQAIKSRPDLSFYLFPYTNNSTEMARKMVELLN